MPILIRGIYFEGWHLDATPGAERKIEDFLARVERELPPQFPRNALDVTKAVFDLLWQKLDPGETAKVVRALPIPLRVLWPAIAR